MLDNFRASEQEQRRGYVCKNCGDEFYDTECGTNYCSDVCVMEKFKLEEIYYEEYCENCGDPLDMHFGFIQDLDGNKFCDTECFLRYIREI